MNLKKLGEKTYVLESPVNIGFYLTNEEDVCLIDTGNSKDYGKTIAKILTENNWNLKYIINTHSHADHIGGNNFLQNKYGCQIFASKEESYFINSPFLEPAMLYGASPVKDLCHSFLMAKPSMCEDIANLEIPGIEIIDLAGHSHGLIGIVTSDDVCFVGDAYTSRKIIEKYTIQYTYDVEKALEKLNFLKQTNYKYYVPSHGDIEENCIETVNENINALDKIEKQILEILNVKNTFNEILDELINIYHIKSNIEQYHIIGVTVKAMITKLLNEEKIELSVKNGQLWLVKKTI